MSEQDAAETDDAGAADSGSAAATRETDSEAGTTAADASDEVTEADSDSEATDRESETGATAADADSTDEASTGGGDRESDTVADLVGEVLDAEASDAEPGLSGAEGLDTGGVAGTVRDASAEETARAVVLLRQRVGTLEDEVGSRKEEIADLEDRLRRKQADFQNYKKRQKERLEEEKRRATEDLVERLLDVRDSLARALDQDEDADIRGGVETTLAQFDEQLKRENVERIEPGPGDEVDPERHEALATIASDQPEDTVAEVHRPGYEMAGKIIRPAQVAVSDGSGGV
jgi:molecular chaperone GrpE